MGVVSAVVPVVGVVAGVEGSVVGVEGDGERMTAGATGFARIGGTTLGGAVEWRESPATTAA